MVEAGAGFCEDEDVLAIVGRSILEKLPLYFRHLSLARIALVGGDSLLENRVRFGEALSVQLVL